MAKLMEVARPGTSLETDLEVGSFVSERAADEFRILIKRGAGETVRPSLWR
ncbi:MAG: hypothetical protein V1798_03395 [Pseudomonadota bacterium]